MSVRRQGRTTATRIGACGQPKKVCTPLFALVLALGFSSAPAGADINPLRDDEVSMAGAGATLLCGQWLEDRREPVGRQRDPAAWILGFLSGAATWSSPQQQGTGRNPLRGLRAEDALTWIDNWCHARPSHPLHAAASAFVSNFSNGRH